MTAEEIGVTTPPVNWPEPTAIPVELTARHVTVRARDVEIIRDVSASVEAGRVLGVVGPNGSGKSTLLRCMAGLTSPDAGEVLLAGKDMRELTRTGIARQLTYVEQSTSTDIDLRVADVVALGRLPFRSRFAGPSRTDEAVCAAALQAVGLAGFERRRWSTLSGGERQRVQWARALAQNPAVVLLDEPTNHLDVHHQFVLLDLLRASGRTLVVVLHDLNLAARCSDRLLVMHRGAVAAEGPSETVLTSEMLEEVFAVRSRIRTDDVGAVRVDFLGASNASHEMVQPSNSPRLA